MRAVIILTFGFILWLGGFVAYVYDADQLEYHKTAPSNAHDKRDAIVVLTGGKNRIKEGLNLLKRNAAPELLISGVLGEHSKREVIRYSGYRGHAAMHRVHIDYKATNTVENALYSDKWIRDHGIKRIYLVTSTYHMRRALLEFKSKNPNIDIHPHAVNPLAKGKGPWSKSKKVLYVYLFEYTKYLGVLVKTNLLYLIKITKDKL